MIRTFAGSSISIANTYSTSTLRSSINYVINSLSDVDIDYFPSFEIVSNAKSWDFWQRDIQHIKSGGVALLVCLLAESYIDDADEKLLGYLKTFAFTNRLERERCFNLAKTLAEKLDSSELASRANELAKTFT